jgi:hypothetical protein
MVEDRHTMSIQNDELYIEEYKALKLEISANTEKMYAMIQYVVLISAVVYAFLLGYTHENPSDHSAHLPEHIPALARTIVWSIPTVASIIGALLNLILGYHSVKIGNYIKEYIEGKHLPDAYDGWEHYVSKKRIHKILAIPAIIAWLIVIGLNITALSLAIHTGL